MKSLICEIGEKIFLEIPHQRPPKCFVLSEHELKKTIFDGNYGDYFETWAVNNDYCKPAPNFHLPDGDDNPDFDAWERELFSNQDALIGYMGHDLHGLHVFDTVKEALEWCDSEEKAKGHQWVKAIARICHLVRAEQCSGKCQKHYQIDAMTVVDDLGTIFCRDCYKSNIADAVLTKFG